MSTSDYLWLIVLMTFTTVFTRSFFFMLGRSWRMPGWLQKSLGYVPAVALAAILAPDLLLANGALLAPWMNIKLMAAVASTIFFLLTRHLLGTLVFGMACFTALRLWF